MQFSRTFAMATLIAVIVMVSDCVSMPRPPVPDGRTSPSSTGSHTSNMDSSDPKGKTSATNIRQYMGGQQVNLTLPAIPNGTLVVAVHGDGGGVDEWSEGSQSVPRLQTPLMDALFAAGYAIATSEAQGNAWGNPDSVDAYLDLYAWAKTKGNFESTSIIGQSMGGLASLQLISKLPDVKAWIGIYPVCNLSTVVAGFPDTAEAWPGGTNGILAPVGLEDVRGIRMLFFASDGDTVVPKATNTDLCALSALRAGATVRVVTVAGDHGDPSAFQPDEVLSFLAQG